MQSLHCVSAKLINTCWNAIFALRVCRANSYLHAYVYACMHACKKVKTEGEVWNAECIFSSFIKILPFRSIKFRRPCFPQHLLNTHASNNNHEQQKKYIDRIHYVWDGFGQESWSCVVIYNMKLD